MKIVDIARSFVGEHETANTNKFEGDTEFEKLIKAAGHIDGEAWCALTGEVIAKKAYPEKFDEFDKLFSKGAVKTLENFRKAGYPVSLTPSVGALVIWQRYKDGVPQWEGHLGIVVETTSPVAFRSVEGNTTAKKTVAGKIVREGGVVAENPHTIVPVHDGLRVIGFVPLML